VGRDLPGPLRPGAAEGLPRRQLRAAHDGAYDEVQALFDAADARPRAIRGQGRKGALTALRDAAVIKTIYAFGTRRTESSCVDLPDLRRNRNAPQFGQFGSMTVRFGKASRGGPAKRLTVLTVPEMDWIVGVLGEWVHEVRPRLEPGRHPALWVTERAGRLSPRSINEAFAAARQDAGLDEDLDLHCLRHSYITHLKRRGVASDAIFRRSREDGAVRDAYRRSSTALSGCSRETPGQDPVTGQDCIRCQDVASSSVASKDRLMQPMQRQKPSTRTGIATARAVSRGIRQGW
jgi:integrase